MILCGDRSALKYGLKKLILYLLTCNFSLLTSAQYYLRGEIKDTKNQGIQNVQIFVHSKKAMYTSGTQGSFGITVQKLFDSLTLSREGFESLTIRIKTDAWQSIILKSSIPIDSKSKPKLISLTKNNNYVTGFNRVAGDETYFQLVENDYITASKFPATGFSLHVNKASYSNVRRFLNMGSQVPRDAVKIEEMINYFNLQYKEPLPNENFNFTSQVTDCPWNSREHLLFLNTSARKLSFDNIPPGNFVFLIDVSGSMDMPNRLPLLQAAFQMLVKNLRAVDKVSIVTYGGSVGIWLQPTSGDQKEKINASIESLTASGDTPGESAIRTAYRLAQSTFIKDGNNRIILATDGDFNVGETSEKALEELIASYRSTAVYLTCLGVGMGNLKDSKLQTLAKKGNGNYAYLDNINEAERILVKELTQTIYAVADNAKLNISFDPAVVKRYRLIGYDNKKEAITDSTTELEGGEVGSGNSTMAVFQIELVDPIQSISRDLAQVSLQYTMSKALKKIDFAVPNNYAPLDSVDKELKFASAISMFALKLKQSAFVGEIDWDMVSDLANTSASNNFLQTEFVQLIEKAKKIYPAKKKKKKISLSKGPKP